ncbi:C-C chemokine receptor type 3-like [Asterias rubens]|uniref:C-C chemokine receptor type 3-like n=1 Tax=Asterias rubens TaxID=7604 RepID=UPI00145553A5|nr:C-C chemokine receptor type 3-like [Asterias rubens]
MADEHCAQVTIGLLNLTDADIAADYTYSQAVAILTTVINPVMFTIGIFGNFCFVFTIARVRYMWTVLNIYLANMALCAVLVLVSLISNTLVRYQGSSVPWDFSPLGSIGCVFVNVVHDIALWAALVFGGMVNLVLYRAVLRPFQFRRLGERKSAIVLSTGTWLCSCCIGAAFSPTWLRLDTRCVAWPDTEQYSMYPDYIGVCSPVEEWVLIFHDLAQTICFFVGGLIGIFTYATIFKKLKRVNPSPPEGNKQPLPRGRQRHVEVIKMVMISSVVFYTFPMTYKCALFARSIAKLTNNYILSEMQHNYLMLVANNMMYVAPAICPYIYALTNSRYRSALVTAFTHGCRKKHHHFVIRTDRMSTMHMTQQK